MCKVKVYSALFGVLVVGAFSLVSCSPTGDDTSLVLVGNTEKIVDSIYAISSEDPSNSTWVAYQSEKNMIEGDETYTLDISFGTRLTNIKYFEVTTESEDFEIAKSCPDRYEVGWKYYKDEEFYVPYGTELTYDNLPMKFTVTLDKKWKKREYSGCVEIKIIGYMRGGSDGATIRLHYYGDEDLICFSPQKQAATNIYMLKK